MDVEALFDTNYVPPEPEAPPEPQPKPFNFATQRLQPLSLLPAVPDPIYEREELNLEELNRQQEEWRRDMVVNNRIKRQEQKIIQTIEERKEQAYSMVQNHLVDASIPAVNTVVSLLEAKRSIVTKDGDIIEVPDPKIQLAAAKDILDRAGHQTKQAVDITSNGESISDLYLAMMARRQQSITVNEI